MNRIEKYTTEVMLNWLTEHFKYRGYDTEHYSERFLPARVPLYCRMEGNLEWSKIPGIGNAKLKEFLSKIPDSNWIENATINKSDDGNSINVTYEQNSIIVSLKDKRLFIKKNQLNLYEFVVEEEGDEIDFYDEIVVEITTDKYILKDDFFPLLAIGRKKIPEASPVRFYKHYFPKARIYYSFPQYVEENDGFKEFKEVCLERGIGLLKTSETKIEEVCKSVSLFDEICSNLYEKKNSRKSIETIIGNYFEDNLDQLVFYPEPDYKRRAIVRRLTEDNRISLLLLKKLQNPKNIQYKDKLKKLTSDYLLKETRDDFNIASEYVKELWTEYLGMEYPNPDIQIKFEEIFQKDKGYREHFVHQFQVFLLGSYIIDKLYESRNEILESFKKSYGVPIEIGWLAASTYHDFNYSTQKYQTWLIEYLTEVLRFENEEVKGELSKLNLDTAIVRESFLLTSEKLINIICKKYIEVNSSIKQKINLFLYETIVRKKNHGLLSSLTLMKIFNTTKNRKLISEKGIEQAALAIALHDEKMWEFFCGCKGYLLEEKNCEKGCSIKHNCSPWDKDLMECGILRTISFETDPLIYLLILCDSVQDEGRVEEQSEFIKSHIKDVEVTIDKKVVITLVSGDSNSHRIKQTEFSRVEQFLDDGGFEIVLKPNKPSYGKEKKIIF
ncbi:MAG: hypothetical protein KKG99_09850 [Bacteroidetes bacterium]|nr:hypothetical protein [Bacteroidota bacterium]